MWNETKQSQLDLLQKRRDKGNLTVEEQKLLEMLFSELEQEEWQTLNPPLQKLRDEQIELQKEINQTKTQNAVITAFASRQEDLLKKARTQLAALRLEHESLRSERKRVLEDLAV